jgi:helicase required for RNAi-mediated heterochromatin assembly 1
MRDEADHGQELKGLRDVYVTVVDNYQGEENDIILLSLVRSNPERRIGFLATENRVCVALSRAKAGLFIVGNMEMLAENSETWQAIRTSLNDQEALGTQFPLRYVSCQFAYRIF